MNAVRTAGRATDQQWVLCCRIVIFSLLGVARFAAAEAPLDVIAEFDVRPSGDLLTVPVIIKGRHYPFVLDTGASGWIVDESLRPLLGGAAGSMIVKTADDDIEAVRYAMAPVQVGPFAIQPRSAAVCAAFHRDAPLLGQDVYGVVCTEFLRGKIFRIDFDRGKIQFLKRAANDAGERLKLTWKEGAPYIGLAVGDLPEEDFLVDTGCCGFSGNLRKEFFDELVAKGRLKLVAGHEVHGYAPLAEVATTAPLARLDCLAVGPFRHQGLLFTRSSRTIIGLGYLSRYVVTFDLDASVMYLKPGRGFAQPDRYGLGGIGLERVGEKTIAAIDSPGPAAAAGLRDSDEIIEVDGVAASRTSVFELRRTFATPGRHRIRFVHPHDNGVERVVTIVLADPEQEGTSAAAQPGSEWVGRKFMPKAGCVMKIGERKISSDRSLPYVIRQVSGEWLWIGEGWVQKSQVVPFNSAAGYYTDYIQSHPDSSWAYRLRGAVWHEKGDLDNALKDYTEAIRLKPRSAPAFAAYASRGTVWSEKGDLDNAMKDFTEAIRLDPQSALAYGKRGMIWLNRRELDNAMKDFMEATRLDPRCAMFHNARGLVWWFKDELDNAIDAYTEAIRLDAKNAGAYSARGGVWRQKKEFGKAIADYSEAIRLSPQDADAYNRRAWIWATCSDPKYRDGKGAIESATRACELTDWKNWSYINTLAAAYAEAGDFASAVQYGEQACSTVFVKDKQSYQTCLDAFAAQKPWRDD